MNFEFEIEDVTLRQKKTSIKSKNTDNLFCSFTFTTSNWKYIEKYAIFWNRKGKNTIRYIGNGMKEVCELPQMVLNDLHFYVQVYANDEVCTQKAKVHTLHEKPIKKEKWKENIEDFCEKNKKKIDNIVFEDNHLLLYSENMLIKKFQIYDDRLLIKILQDNAPQFIVDTILSSTSEHPLANKTLYRLLKSKVDTSALHNVAITGDYNDLENKPESFPPSPHFHFTNDIINFNESVNSDLNDLLSEITDSLEERDDING